MNRSIIAFAFLALLVVACKSKPTEVVDAHAHEDVKVQLTGYSTDFELFAEADAFVVGKTSNVLSHFTHLPNFKALELGSVTIKLLVGSTEIIQKLDSVTRKGICSFDLKPTTPGVGKIIYEIQSGQKTSQIIIPDVTVYTTEELADEAAEKNVVSKTNTVVFTKEQSWKIDFATDLPRIEPFGQAIKASALVQSAPGDELTISANTNGVVMYSGDAFLEGKSISQGKSLFSISGNNLSDNNLGVRIVEAQSNYDRTKIEYDRKKALAADKIVSDKDLLVAKNEYQNAKALYDMLQKNFSTGGQAVSSPISGFVKQVFVSNGQFVTAGQPIISISKNKSLVLRADVQQKNITFLRSFKTANIRTLHDNKTYTLEQLNGKMLSIGQNTNSDNYLIPVILQIDNIGGFIPGEFVELYLKTISNSTALTIPSSALMEEQGNYFVFTQVHPELFEKKEVTIGTSDGLRTEIKSGIGTSERVVTNGAIIVKLAQGSGTLDAHSGHVH